MSIAYIYIYIILSSLNPARKCTAWWSRIVSLIYLHLPLVKCLNRRSGSIPVYYNTGNIHSSLWMPSFGPLDSVFWQHWTCDVLLTPSLCVNVKGLSTQFLNIMTCFLLKGLKYIDLSFLHQSEENLYNFRFNVSKSLLRHIKTCVRLSVLYKNIQQQKLFSTIVDVYIYLKV